MLSKDISRFSFWGATIARTSFGDKNQVARQEVRLQSGRNILGRHGWIVS